MCGAGVWFTYLGGGVLGGAFWGMGGASWGMGGQFGMGVSGVCGESAVLAIFYFLFLFFNLQSIGANPMLDFTF